MKKFKNYEEVFRERLEKAREEKAHNRLLSLLINFVVENIEEKTIYDIAYSNMFADVFIGIDLDNLKDDLIDVLEEAHEIAKPELHNVMLFKKTNEGTYIRVGEGIDLQEAILEAFNNFNLSIARFEGGIDQIEKEIREDRKNFLIVEI